LFYSSSYFGCFFLSEDKNELENIEAQHIVYKSIGTLGGFSKSGISMAKTIITLSDNIDNPDIEAIVNCYTNTNATVFRDHLKAVNYAMGQFCKVQQNLQATSATPQNKSEKCTEPKSIILSADELKKLGRQYTGDYQADIAICKK
jgi:hypothetical protein